MSSAQGLPLSARPARAAGTPEAGRPRLRVAAPPDARPSRGPFVLLVAGMLGLGLLGLLLLNTVLAQDAFVLHDLQGQSAQLRDQEQALQREIAAEAAPGKLAARAAALGMVPSENPVFLRLRDGKVLGVPAPAKKPLAPKPTRTAANSAHRAPATTGPAARPSATGTAGSPVASATQAGAAR